MSRSRRALSPSDDPHGFPVLIANYLLVLRRKSFSEYTVRRVEGSLVAFGLYCEARELRRPSQVTRPVVERYAVYLYEYRTASGSPLVVATQRNMLQVVKQFLGHLVRDNRILYNPASELEMPRRARRIPRAVLSHEEVERVFAQPDLRTLVGVRDRAILETFYSTGVRRFELVRLELLDLDVSRRTVFVRDGKGRKDRVVPIGERALEWNVRYLERVRPAWARSGTEKRLYVTERGEGLTLGSLGNSVREYLEKAEIAKEGGCHLFRHSMATAMLEGGADLRSIQEMLGHASLESTQIYTRVSIAHLQTVHERTHPTSKPMTASEPERLARRGSPRSLARVGYKSAEASPSSPSSSALGEASAPVALQDVEDEPAP